MQALRRALSLAALVVLDLMGVFVGLYAAFALKLLLKGQEINSGPIWVTERKALPLTCLTVVLVFAVRGLYAPREQRQGIGRILAAVTLATLIVATFLVTSGYRFDTYYIFYSSWILVGVSVTALRASYDSLTALVLEHLRYTRRALLIGAPALVEPIAQSLEAGRDMRRSVTYRVVGRHQLVPGISRDDATGAAGDLRRALDPDEVDEVILTGATGNDAPVMELLDLCRRRGIPVRLAPSTVELLSHQIRAVPAPGLPLFELRPPVLSSMAFRTKRAFDLVVGGLLLVAFSPLLGAAALAILVSDGRPVLYRSRRVGVEETRFDCLKLRTMVADAARLQGDLEHANEAGGALFKMRADPRVTRVGRVLRRLSLDELPQLVNVLRGEMSLVGPRPLPERDYERLDDLHKKRYLVLPGVTGLWQVSGRSALSFDELVRLDFYYIEHWSIWLDMTVLLRTLPAVVARRGAW